MASPQKALLPWIPVTDGLPSGDEDEVCLVYGPDLEDGGYSLATCVDNTLRGVSPDPELHGMVVQPRTGEWWPVNGGARFPRGAVTHYCRLNTP